MNKKNQFLMKWSAFVAVVGIVYMAIQCYFSIIPIPIETYFAQIRTLEAVYSGTRGFSGFVNSAGEHGMLATNLITWINAKVFGLSLEVDWGIVVGLICLSGGIVLWRFAREIPELHNHKSKAFSIIAIGVVGGLWFFNNDLGTGMNNQVRWSLLFAILQAVMIERFIRNRSISALLCAVVTIVLGINVFGTLYNFAILPFVFLVLIWEMVREKNPRKRILFIALFLIYLLSAGGYFIEYNMLFFGNEVESVEATTIMETIIKMIMNPEVVVKGYLAFFASGILGYDIYSGGAISDTAYLAFGIIMMVVYIVAIYVFFKDHMYEESYIPLFLMGYSLFILPEIMIARFREWPWYISTWYTIHAKLLPVGAIWILTKYGCRNRCKSRIWMPVIMIVMLCMGFAALFGSYFKLRNMKFYKLAYEAAAPYLFVETKEELIGEGEELLFNDAETLMAGIEFMKEHSLGVYRYQKYQTKMDQITGKSFGCTLDTAGKKQGIHHDGWIEKQASMLMMSGSEGKIEFTVNAPFETKTSYIQINDTIHEIHAPVGISNHMFDVPPDSILSISIDNSEFAEARSKTDTRELSYVLMDIQAR